MNISKTITVISTATTLSRETSINPTTVFYFFTVQYTPSVSKPGYCSFKHAFCITPAAAGDFCTICDTKMVPDSIAMYA